MAGKQDMLRCASSLAPPHLLIIILTLEINAVITKSKEVPQLMLTNAFDKMLLPPVRQGSFPPSSLTASDKSQREAGTCEAQQI
jgi:hypothetical protein